MHAPPTPDHPRVAVLVEDFVHFPSFAVVGHMKDPEGNSDMALSSAGVEPDWVDCDIHGLVLDFIERDAEHVTHLFDHPELIRTDDVELITWPVVAPNSARCFGAVVRSVKPPLELERDECAERDCLFHA